MRGKWFIPFLLVFVFACEKDEEFGILFSYPSVYHKTGLDSNGNFRVFSSGGEIKNKSIIDRYMEYDTVSFNYFKYNVSSYSGFLDSISFINPQLTQIDHEYTDQDCSLAHEGKFVVLTQKNITNTCCTYGEVVTRSVRYYIGQIKPEVDTEYLYSSVGGFYNFGFTGRKKFMLQEYGGQLAAPLIQYTLRTGDTHLFDIGFINNVLQPDFYKNLNKGDTITLKESLVVYKK